MAEYEDDFEWEPIEFTTEDGYILTSFIIKKIGHEMGNPPVLVHHGNGQDAATWIKSLTPANPRFDEEEVIVECDPEDIVEPEESVEDETTVEPEAEGAAEQENGTTENNETTDGSTATDENTEGDGGLVETTPDVEEEEEKEDEPCEKTEIKQVRWVEDTPFML